MKRIGLFLFLLLTLLALAPTTYAVGEAAVPVLVIPTPIRSYGMGETGVADEADPGNAFYNPANLSSLHGWFLTGGYSNLIPMLADDVSMMNIGVAGGVWERRDVGRTVRIAAAVHYAKLDYGKWWETSPSGEQIAEHRSYERYFRVSVAGGFMPNDIFHLGAGVSAKHWRVDLCVPTQQTGYSGGDDSNWALDLGVRLKATVSTEADFLLAGTLGISYLNLGSGPRFDGRDESAPLPENVRVGLGFRLEGPRVGILGSNPGHELRAGSVSTNLDITNETFGSNSTIINWGLEVGFLEVAFARIGYVKNKDGKIEDFTCGFGFGIQYRYVVGRFVFARRPLAEDLGHENKYGGTFGLLL